jgi:hypothetical protein
MRTLFFFVGLFALLGLTFNSVEAQCSGNCADFIRGDANGDGDVDDDDKDYILAYLYSGGPRPVHSDDAGDADDDGDIDLADSIFIDDWVDDGLVPPPAPFPNSGLDRTEDNLAPDCDWNGICTGSVADDGSWTRETCPMSAPWEEISSSGEEGTSYYELVATGWYDDESVGYCPWEGCDLLTWTYEWASPDIIKTTPMILNSGDGTTCGTVLVFDMIYGHDGQTPNNSPVCGYYSITTHTGPTQGSFIFTFSDGTDDETVEDIVIDIDEDDGPHVYYVSPTTDGCASSITGCNSAMTVTVPGHSLAYQLCETFEGDDEIYLKSIQFVTQIDFERYESYALEGGFYTFYTIMGMPYFDTID